jgi:hypothetical protein
VRDARAGEAGGGAALRREIGCIMLAGFKRIGPGMDIEVDGRGVGDGGVADE